MAYTPDTHLSFNLQRGDAHLSFGAADVPVSARAQMVMAIRLSALRSTLTLAYDNLVSRDPAPCFATPVQAGVRRAGEITARESVAPTRQIVRTQASTTAQACGQALTETVRRQAAYTRLLQNFSRRQAALNTGYLSSLAAQSRADQAPAMRWQPTDPVGMARAASLQAMWRYERDMQMRWQTTRSRAEYLIMPGHPGLPIWQHWQAVWQRTQLPRPGQSHWTVNPGGDVQEIYIPSSHLTFRWPAAEVSPHLTFLADSTLAPREPVRSILIRSLYFMLNSVSLVRVDTGRELVCLALEVSVDADSWTLSWSANLAYNEYEALRAERGQPIELLATLNGHAFRLLMEGSPQRQRSFGQTTVKIQGRGYSAWLDAPYADISTFSNPDQARTAQQLMADALSTNGVSLGWDLDWQIPDWLVPAGAWSHQGTNMAAVIEIANSVGAIVQTSAIGKQLQILPRYPIAPWAWADANPDLRIPLAITTTDSIESSVKPAYNGVYVTGQSYGITGLVKRTGTAGDLLASTVSHALITHADAARQRGIAILGASGRQESISMTLPLNEDTGLIRLNMLAEVPDTDDTWRGLVRSVGLSASWGDTEGTTIWQKIELERHYDN